MVKQTTRSKSALVPVAEKIPSGKKPWMHTENAKKRPCLATSSRRLRKKGKAKARAKTKGKEKARKEAKAKAKVAKVAKVAKSP